MPLLKGNKKRNENEKMKGKREKRERKKRKGDTCLHSAEHSLKAYAYIGPHTHPPVCEG